jgi:hypothetical protein
VTYIKIHSFAQEKIPQDSWYTSTLCIKKSAKYLEVSLLIVFVLLLCTKIFDLNKEVKFKRGAVLLLSRMVGNPIPRGHLDRGSRSYSWGAFENIILCNNHSKSHSETLRMSHQYIRSTFRNLLEYCTERYRYTNLPLPL